MKETQGRQGKESMFLNVQRDREGMGKSLENCVHQKMLNEVQILAGSVPVRMRGEYDGVSDRFGDLR